MSFLTTFILVVIAFFFFLDSSSEKESPYFSTIPKKQKTKTEEKTSIPNNLRVIQQVIYRQSAMIEDQVRDLFFKQQETKLSKLSLEVGREQVKALSDFVTAKGEGLENKKKEIELMEKEGHIKLQEYSVDLQQKAAALKIEEIGIVKKEAQIEIQNEILNVKAMQNIVGRKLDEIDIGKMRLGIESDKLDLNAAQNELLKKINMAEIREEKLDLTEIRNDISNKLKVLDIKAENLNLAGRELEIQAALNELMKKSGLLSLQEEKINLDSKAVDLDKKEVILDRKNNDNLLNLGFIAIGKKNLELEHRALELLYKARSLQLQETMMKIKNGFEELELAKKAWKVERWEDRLKLYHQDLKNLETYINQMYEVKMNWLQLQERENHLDYREERLALDEMYEKTVDKIEELRLTRWENDLIWREKEMANKKSALGFIENLWGNKKLLR